MWPLASRPGPPTRLIALRRHPAFPVLGLTAFPVLGVTLPPFHGDPARYPADRDYRGGHGSDSFNITDQALRRACDPLMVLLVIKGSGRNYVDFDVDNLCL